MVGLSLVCFTYAQTPPGGNSDPTNPANWIITESISGNLTEGQWTLNSSGKPVETIYSEDLSNGTWSPTTGGTAPDAGASTLPGQSANLNWNAQIIFSIQWVGNGQAPTVAYFFVTSSGQMDGGPDSSGSVADGLGGSASIPTPGSTVTTTCVQVRLLDGQGQYALNSTGNGNITTPAGAQFGDTLTGGFGASMWIANRAACTDLSLNPTYEKGIDGLPEENVATDIMHMREDTALDIPTDPSIYLYPNPPINVQVGMEFSTTLFGQWGLTQGWSYQSNYPGNEENWPNQNNFLNLFTIPWSEVENMAKGNPLQVITSCTVSSSAPPGFPVTSQCEVFLHAPLENIKWGTQVINNTQWLNVAEVPAGAPPHTISYQTGATSGWSVGAQLGPFEASAIAWLQGIGVSVIESETNSVTETVTCPSDPSLPTYLWRRNETISNTMSGDGYEQQGFVGQRQVSATQIPDLIVFETTHNGNPPAQGP